MCKKIHRGGNAEQFNADKKYKEAVAVAVEACAEDTKGQTCYICTQALHWRTKEGLVRGCSCRGTAGFVHVSCLAEQAKILVAEAEENNWDDDRFQPRWRRWYSCSLCEQEYHGVVACALGWACWKTYVGRPEGDWARFTAMNVLGNGLHGARHYEDALTVYETELSVMRRRGAPEENIIATQNNLATAYERVGRVEEALRVRQEIYSGSLKLLGEEHRQSIITAYNYATSLHDLRRYAEAKSLLRKTMPVARRALGDTHEMTLRIRSLYGEALYKDAAATLGDLRENVETLEDTVRTARRTLGSAHPTTTGIEKALRQARAVLRARETPPPPGSAP